MTAPDVLGTNRTLDSEVFNRDAMAQTFASVRAAAIDGRMQNVFYRQHQLEALHQSMIDHASEIRQALENESGYSSAESTVELHLTVERLKRVYGNLRPEKMLADEYALATGKDAPLNRVPAGIVYIQPSSHSLLFSIVAPLSAAIAAGNCVIVLVSPTREPNATEPSANSSSSA